VDKRAVDAEQRAAAAERRTVAAACRQAEVRGKPPYWRENAFRSHGNNGLDKVLKMSAKYRRAGGGKFFAVQQTSSAGAVEFFSNDEKH
jgi:hypothetical protein